MTSDDTSGSIKVMFQQQAERFKKLRAESTTVHLKNALLNAPIESLYELSSGCATRSYLRFFDEIEPVEYLGIAVIGELWHDSAVLGPPRSSGTISTWPGFCESLSFNDPTKEGVDLIASSAASFCAIFELFAECRSEISEIDFDDYGEGFLSNEDKLKHEEISKKFWTFVAQNDPEILNDGSQFWSEHLSSALDWRESPPYC